MYPLMDTSRWGGGGVRECSFASTYRDSQLCSLPLRVQCMIGYRVYGRSSGAFPLPYVCPRDICRKFLVFRYYVEGFHGSGLKGSSRRDIVLACDIVVMTPQILL